MEEEWEGLIWNWCLIGGTTLFYKNRHYENNGGENGKLRTNILRLGSSKTNNWNDNDLHFLQKFTWKTMTWTPSMSSFLI